MWHKIFFIGLIIGGIYNIIFAKRLAIRGEDLKEEAEKLFESPKSKRDVSGRIVFQIIGSAILTLFGILGFLGIIKLRP